MMNNFRYSSKLKIFAFISILLIVIGMAVGAAMHCIGGSFFNYGGEYESYKSVTVSYQWVEFGSREEVEKICADAFADEGIAFYAETYGTTTAGGEIVYKFADSTSSEKLDKAVEAIKAAIANSMDDYSDVVLSNARWNQSTAIIGGGFTLWRGAVALAVVVAVQLIYMIIRYKLAAAIAAFCADLHNFALYAALLAICRIPVTSSALAFGILAVLATAIGFGFTADRIKRNLKDEDNRKLSVAEISDMSAAQTSKINVLMPVVLAAIALVAFGLMAISSMSVMAVISPLACALVAFVTCIYGTAFVAPSAYPAIRALTAKITPKSSKKNK